MADISTGKQRGIVPFVDETTGRLPDQYLPQGVIDLQGDLEQAVSDASASATAAQQSASQAQSNATAADSSAQAAAVSAAAAQTATESAASSKDAAARSASEASASAQAAEASKTNAASSASAAEASKTNAAASASAAQASETNAVASATAAQRAVDGFGLQVGTTTTGEPGTDAAVEIQKNGSKYTANFTIPRGDKGADGVNENVPLGSASGVVAHASDAYPALPRKVQVHGRTVENLCPVFNTVNNGVTFSTDANGYISIKGTATDNIYEQPPIANLPQNTKVWIYVDSDFKAKGIGAVYAQSSGWSIYAVPDEVMSSTTPSATDGSLVIKIVSGVTVDTKIRVMFVASETEPDADLFVPSGVHTVEPTKLIISGVNFADLSQAVRYKNRGALISSKTSSKIEYTGANSNSDTLFDLGITLPAGAYYIDYGNNVSNIGANIQDVTSKLTFNGYWGVYYSNPDRITFDEPFNLFISPKAGSGVIDDFQISLTDSEYKEPIVSNISIPSDISLADGDTLTIDRDGTTQIIHAEGEPTVLENVTLPELPAPTFNAYTTGGYIQPTVDVDYERDVNLVLEALEAKIAALQVADKTN